MNEVSELQKGYRLSTENGWQIPANAVSMSSEQVLKLNSFDEVELNMNDFWFYAQKKLSASKRIVVWAKSFMHDMQPDGVVYLSVIDENMNAIETHEVINSYESEGGRFFDVFDFDANNCFSKSRMINGKEGTDVVFRYEYQINDNGTIELKGEFVNRSVVDEIDAENAKRTVTIFDYGLTFLSLDEPFDTLAIPKWLTVSETPPGYSYELMENGAIAISFVLVNNLVEEIRIYSQTFTTENNIRVSSTFSQLKNAYDIESIQCRADEGVWATVKGKPYIDYQLDLPGNIRCNSDDEVPVSLVPDDVKITCIRLVGID